MSNFSNEFPLLRRLGLYVKSTAGNGNCLFHALSDQLYGHQNKHMELRAGVIKHMRKRAAHYKQFIDVRPAGWGKKYTPRRFTDTPSAAQINQAFESHLQKMARGGTYGDNMELSAFSEAFNVDIRIYQRDLTYLISTKPEGTVVPVLHIAYHAWEHYSSVRNIRGPHNGLPRITPSSIPAPTGERNRKKNKKMGMLSDEPRRQVNASVMKLKDTKQHQVSAFPNSKQGVSSDAKPGLLDRRAGRRERKKRRRLINRAERDRLLAEQKKSEKSAPRLKAILKDVCI